MKPYYNCWFSQKEDVPLDVQTFQEARRFPLSWRTHMEHVVAYAFGYDRGADCFSGAQIRISLSRDSFVNRRGDFAWHEFHALLEKLENRLAGYGFEVDGSFSEWETGCVAYPSDVFDYYWPDGSYHEAVEEDED